MRSRQENGMACLIMVMWCTPMIQFVTAGATIWVVLLGRTRSLFRPIGCGYIFFVQEEKMYLPWQRQWAVTVQKWIFTILDRWQELDLATMCAIGVALVRNQEYRWQAITAFTIIWQEMRVLAMQWQMPKMPICLWKMSPTSNKTMKKEAMLLFEVSQIGHHFYQTGWRSMSAH